MDPHKRGNINKVYNEIYNNYVQNYINDNKLIYY